MQPPPKYHHHPHQVKDSLNIKNPLIGLDQKMHTRIELISENVKIININLDLKKYSQK